MDSLASPFLGISNATWLTSAATIAMILGADIVLRFVLRDRARAAEAAGNAPATPTEPETSHRALRIIGRGLRLVAAPLALLLWTYGLHFAIAQLLLEGDFDRFGTQALAVLTWLRGALTVIASVWLLDRIGRVIEFGLAEIAARTPYGWDDLLMPVAGRAARLILPLVAVILAAPALEVQPQFQVLIQHGISIALIGVFAFILLRFVDAGAQLILSRHPIDVADNLRARGIRTQITVLRKVAVAVIAIFAIASMLMVFDPVRRLGTTMLASAGVAGIIIGFAAQRSLATLLAGFQLALTQPIRVDDVVIVEGEWGRIEDITLTYVVVAIWDQRRLVVPITYFIEKPFQNWTRTSAELLGTVMIYTDYDAPLAALREELQRLVRTTDLWDGRLALLQVTDAKERTLELRVLVSSSDASRSFDLRCFLREALVEWLQRHHPASLPHVRAEIVNSPVHDVR